MINRTFGIFWIPWQDVWTSQELRGHIPSFVSLFEACKSLALPNQHPPVSLGHRTLAHSKHPRKAKMYVFEQVTSLRGLWRKIFVNGGTTKSNRLPIKIYQIVQKYIVSIVMRLTRDKDDAYLESTYSLQRLGDNYPGGRESAQGLMQPA